jgi:hypothetical protein
MACVSGSGKDCPVNAKRWSRWYGRRHGEGKGRVKKDVLWCEGNKLKEEKGINFGRRGGEKMLKKREVDEEIKGNVCGLCSSR